MSIITNLPENNQIETHINHIASMLKNEKHFFSFREIREKIEKEEWVNPDLILPALAHMIKRGQIKYNPVFGYWWKWVVLKISQNDFDKMRVAQQTEYQSIGGIIE